MIAPLRAFLLVTTALTWVASPAHAADDARLKGSSRGPRNGWITVRLQGTPSEIGY